MAESNENVPVGQFYNNLVFIWLALFVSQFVFLFVVYFIEPKAFEFDFSKPILDQNRIIIVIFAAAAIFNTFLSVILKKRFLDQSVKDQNVAFVQTAMIVGCALCETVTLFGLMLAFIAQYQYFFAWFALGMLGMLVHFPLRKNVINATSERKI